MSKESKSGWFCDLVDGVRMCVPFEYYIDHGFSMDKATSYEELFGHKLNGDKE